MQLLVTLKGIEDLREHLPDHLDRLPSIERLWDFKPTILEIIRKEDDPLVALHCLYNQLPIDLQVLYRTFDVMVTEKNASILINTWGTNPSVASMEIIY